MPATYTQPIFSSVSLWPPGHDEALAGGGRFTLSSSCEVPYETPAENIDAMVRAAREFGAKLNK